MPYVTKPNRWEARYRKGSGFSTPRAYVSGDPAPMTQKTGQGGFSFAAMPGYTYSSRTGYKPQGAPSNWSNMPPEVRRQWMEHSLPDTHPALRAMRGGTGRYQSGGRTGAQSSVEEAFQEAREANQRRYEQGLGEYERAIGEIEDIDPEDYGKGALAQYRRSKEKALAEGGQRYTSQGMYNTTKREFLDKTYEEEVGTPFRLRLADQQSQFEMQRARYLGNLMTQKAGFMAQKEDAYPDLRSYLDLLTQKFSSPRYA